MIDTNYAVDVWWSLVEEVSSREQSSHVESGYLAELTSLVLNDVLLVFFSETFLTDYSSWVVNEQIDGSVRQVCNK